ncbi:MAG TPA: methyltransferase domain-containing protein [Candidatus Doudnabacteria bacterium]|nr:methyltransferase domain-containing protein [Candidatus Doudnabacteria bacterium]
MKFVNPQKIVGQVGLKPGDRVTDLGCGSGFYTTAAAKLVGNTGRVAAIDVQESKLTATKSITMQTNLQNVEVYKADLEKPLDVLPHGGENVVIMASIIHEVKNREALIRNAYALLESGGKLLVVDWKAETSPFGPAMEKRVSEKEIRHELEGVGFRHSKDLDADLYHYAMVFEKQ